LEGRKVGLRCVRLSREDRARLNMLVSEVLRTCLEVAGKLVDELEVDDLRAGRLIFHQLVLDFISMLASATREGDVETVAAIARLEEEGGVGGGS